MPSFATKLNEQIRNEFSASQQYIAVAVYYDSQSLPQLAAHFYRQAVEERNHAMMMVQYLLDADKDVVTPGTVPMLRPARGQRPNYPELGPRSRRVGDADGGAHRTRGPEPPAPLAFER